MPAADAPGYARGVIFTSAAFLAAFLPAVMLLDWAAEAAGARRLRWLLLLLASLFFYAWWRPDHLAVLLFSIAANYGLGHAIEVAPRGRRALLAAGIAVNLLILGAFKYAGFFAANAVLALRLEGFAVPEVALPLGISFFTFTQIAYLVDCANGRRGRHGPVEYALFVAFFPHLLAGPIIHHSGMIPQFQAPRRALPEALDDLVAGLGLLAVGAAKKVVLADNLAPIADAIFGGAAAGDTPGAAQAWLGALAYTFQLYFDFSGYSDMAVGLARLFGVRFPANFDSPYRSTSLVEFWRRWHMTLSRWLRDYLYVPLGGNRGGPVRRYRNLLLTMMLGGLWHGAAWTFVAWGGLHGAGLVVAHLLRAHLVPRLPDGRAAGVATAFLGWAATFAFVVVAWVFFRATSMDAAGRMLAAMAGLTRGEAPVVLGDAAGDLVALAALTAFLAPNSNAIGRALEAPRRAVAAAALVGAAAAAALATGLTSPASSPFLYFNF